MGPEIGFDVYATLVSAIHAAFWCNHEIDDKIACKVVRTIGSVGIIVDQQIVLVLKDRKGIADVTRIGLPAWKTFIADIGSE